MKYPINSMDSHELIRLINSKHLILGQKAVTLNLNGRNTGNIQMHSRHEY